MKTYKAKKGYVYVHKENIELYGQVVMIRESDPYTIEDFKQMGSKKHKEELEALYNKLRNIKE